MLSVSCSKKRKIQKSSKKRNMAENIILALGSKKVVDRRKAILEFQQYIVDHRKRNTLDTIGRKLCIWYCDCVVVLLNLLFKYWHVNTMLIK